MELFFRYYGGGTETLRDRTGQSVVIVRELDDSEIDREEVGRMFRVRFSDGHEADAFAEEIVETGASAALRSS